MVTSDAKVHKEKKRQDEAAKKASVWTWWYNSKKNAITKAFDRIRIKERKLARAQKRGITLGPCIKAVTVTAQEEQGTRPVGVRAQRYIRLVNCLTKRTS